MKRFIQNRNFGAKAREVLMSLPLLFCCSMVEAQSTVALRDSLKEAADRLSYAPDSVDLRLRKASFNLQLEQWQYAMDEYNYILRCNPGNPAALFYRAFANEKLHRYNFARLDYESLLAIVPGHFAGQLGLALLNQKDNHFTEALDMINRLVNQYPDSAVAYAARGGIEMEQGMVSLAVFDYARAVRLDAGNRDYGIDYVEALLRDKKKDEAHRELDRLVSIGVPKASLLDFYKRCR